MRLIAADWRCSPTEANPLLVEVLRDAVMCIGMRETAPNRGPQVDVWLRLAGADPGEPWCAAWATACYQRADPPPIPRLASAAKIRAWAVMHGRLLPIGAALLPGDLCGLVREDGHGHCGIVTEALEGERVCSIEGNVDGKVRGCVRARSAWGWFARVV